MDLSLKATTIAGQTNFLDSDKVRYVRGGITLDAAAVSADGTTGLKKLLAGTFIGKDGSTSKYKKYIPAVAATLKTGVVGSNNAILWTAKTPGTPGNAIRLQLKDPSGNSKPLVVTLENDTIVVSLATSEAGAITSTAAEVIAAVNSALVNGLVVAANDGESTGEGVVAAVDATALAGGTAANVTPTLLLAEDVLFTSFTSSGGVVNSDQVVTAIDQARVITARLPVAPDDVVKANMPGITFA